MIDFGPVWAERALLLNGLGVTVALSGVGLAGAATIGVLVGSAGVSSVRALRMAAIAYVEGVRNIPLLLHIYIWFLGLSALQLPAFACAALGLSIYSGAYAAEIVRGGLLSIPQGQRDAAAALGFGRWRAWRLVVWPQTLRVIGPSLAGLSSQLIKDSSLASVIAVGELAYQAASIEADTFRTTEVYAALTAIYVILVTGIAGAVSWWAARGSAAGLRDA